MVPMRDLSEVLADLIATRSDLDAAPADGNERRVELNAALDRLRIEARQIREADYPAEMARQWRTDLAELIYKWDQAASERVDVVRQSGGGSAGGDFAFAADAMRINRMIDSDRGRADIEARIQELRNLLDGLDT